MIVKVSFISIGICRWLNSAIQKKQKKGVVEFFTFPIISELLFTPSINMSMCQPLVVPTWYPLLGFTWNSIPGEARCGVFLRNSVTYRDHLPLDIFGGWHLWTSPYFRRFMAQTGHPNPMNPMNSYFQPPVGIPVH